MFNFRALASSLAILLLTPLSAHAVSLSLSGNGADVQMDNTQAVYASDANGVPVLITAIGMRLPNRAGAGVVTEVGVPSMMPDGRVIFGAEIAAQGRQPQAAVEYFHRQCRRRSQPPRHQRGQSEDAHRRLHAGIQGRPLSQSPTRTEISPSSRWCRTATMRCSFIRTDSSPASRRPVIKPPRATRSRY